MISYNDIFSQGKDKISTSINYDSFVKLNLSKNIVIGEAHYNYENFNFYKCLSTDFSKNRLVILEKSASFEYWCFKYSLFDDSIILTNKYLDTSYFWEKSFLTWINAAKNQKIHLIRGVDIAGSGEEKMTVHALKDLLKLIGEAKFSNKLLFNKMLFAVNNLMNTPKIKFKTNDYLFFDSLRYEINSDLYLNQNCPSIYLNFLNRILNEVQEYNFTPNSPFSSKKKFIKREDILIKNFSNIVKNDSDKLFFSILGYFHVSRCRNSLHKGWFPFISSPLISDNLQNTTLLTVRYPNWPDRYLQKKRNKVDTLEEFAYLKYIENTENNFVLINEGDCIDYIVFLE